MEMRDTACPQRQVENSWGCGEGREKMSGVFMGEAQLSSQERTLMGGDQKTKEKNKWYSLLLFLVRQTVGNFGYTHVLP